MKLLITISRIVIVVLLGLTLFMGMMAIASGHNIPAKTSRLYEIVIVVLILLIVLLTYLKRKILISDLDNFYLQHTQMVNECLLALRDIILKQDENITAAWKYRMPFFCYKGKMFCYLWVHKTLHKPYIGIVEGKHIHHPNLLTEKRSRMKIMLFDENDDLPVVLIEDILQQTLDLYRSGKVK